MAKVRTIWITAAVCLGCSAAPGDGGPPPDYSKIAEAIGESGCATVTPGYSASAGGATGYYGAFSSTWQSPNCNGFVAQISALSNRSYTHIFYPENIPTSQSVCVNTAIWGEGLDNYCGLSCTGMLADPNSGGYSNPTLYVGSWNGSSCSFVLYTGYNPIQSHSAWQNNASARTVSAALHWNGTSWDTVASYSGLYVN